MTRLHEISGPAGRLEALWEEPGQRRPIRAAVVFAHPHPLHGGTMHTKVVFRGAKTLASLGCAVLRFNFRGVGRSEGSFGAAEGEIEDFGAALDVMATRYPGAELWTAGLSFGAYVSMVAGVADNRVTRLLGIAPPLQRYDFSMLVRSTKPKYFIQGERDEICPLDDMKSFFESLSEPKQLIVVPGADHLFVGQLDDLTQAIETLFGR